MAFAALDQGAVGKLAQRLTPEEKRAVNILVAELNALLKEKAWRDARIASNEARLAKARKQAKTNRDAVLTASLIAAPVVIPAALMALRIPGAKKFVREKLEDKVGAEAVRLGLGQKDAHILERALDFIGYLTINTATKIGKVNFLMMVVGEFFRSPELNPADDEREVASLLDEQIAAKLALLIAILDHDEPYLPSAMKVAGPGLHARP